MSVAGLGGGARCVGGPSVPQLRPESQRGLHPGVWRLWLQHESVLIVIKLKKNASDAPSVSRAAVVTSPVSNLLEGH